jgi:hypothetical protein
VLSERITEYQYDLQYLLHNDVAHTKKSHICVYESGVHMKWTQLSLLLTEYVTFPAWWRSWEGKMKRMDENIISLLTWELDFMMR